MDEMKDKFLYGALFGMLADIPKEIADFTIYFCGSKFYCWMIPAGITLSPKWNSTIPGIIIGGINDFIIAGVLGVGLTYFLTIMEKKHLFLKGIAYSLGVWLFFCMMIVTRVSYWVRMEDPGFYFQNFAVHQIWGLVATWLIIKYLFPEEKKSSILK
jgi:hypothetical protein